jgi:3-hydroxybutyrate dehydrogenase
VQIEGDRVMGDADDVQQEQHLGAASAAPSASAAGPALAVGISAGTEPPYAQEEEQLGERDSSVGKPVSDMAGLAASCARRVLITGGGSGIGAGIAHGLARRGHGIVVSDMVLPAAERVAEEIRAQGGKAEALQLDVSSEEAIRTAVGSLKEPVDVLVNNAGIQHVARLEEFPPEKFQLLLNVLLYGPCMLSRACLPAMRSKGYGRIINIGSIHGLVGSPYKSAYVAAKHGLIGVCLCVWCACVWCVCVCMCVCVRVCVCVCVCVCACLVYLHGWDAPHWLAATGFSKVIALETGDVDVTINTICPAYVRTPLVDKQIAATVRAEACI